MTAANALTLRRTLYYGPDQWQLDLITGYQRKLGRYTWRSTLNVNNLFNHYLIAVLPDATTGYTAINATWYQQPRTYTWTNTVGF